MIVNLSRAKIEGAKSMGFIPKPAIPLIDSILSGFPEVESVSLEIKAFDKEGKEKEMSAHLKTMFMSLVMSALTSKK